MVHFLKIIIFFFSGVCLFWPERDSPGNPLWDCERMGEVHGGGRPRLALPNGHSVHHGGGPLRSQGAGEILPRKVGHLGKSVLLFTAVLEVRSNITYTVVHG